jgi:hypothetical protein
MKGRGNMMIITSIVKEVNIKTGQTKIITVSELMNDYPGHEENIRITIEHFGTLKMGDRVYHAVNGEPYVDLMGKSVLFELKDFDDILVKVQGIKFGELIVGQDDEGMNVAVEISQIESYYLPGMGMKR